MPTNRRRHAVTETDDITSAIAAAKHRWPALATKPGALLRQLILEGWRSIEDEKSHARRLADIEATRGALAGVYGPGYLSALREDWPA